MKSILEIKGLAVGESVNLIKVLPIKEAVRKNVEIIIDGKKTSLPSMEDDTVTFLQEIRRADAEEVAKALRALKSANTDIVVYQPINTIIYSGTSTEIKGLVKIAEALDRTADDGKKDGGPEQSRGNIHVVNLENASAVQLAEVLSRIPFSETAKIETAPLLPPISARIPMIHVRGTGHPQRRVA